MDTFYFKPKATFPEAKEFYLRFNNDDILYFKEKEHNIFSALDIYKLLVKGKINNITIDSITFLADLLSIFNLFPEEFKAVL